MRHLHQPEFPKLHHMVLHAVASAYQNKLPGNCWPIQSIICSEIRDWPLIDNPIEESVRQFSLVRWSSNITSALNLFSISTKLLQGGVMPLSYIIISILDFFHDTFPNPNRLSLKHQGLWRPQPLWEQTKARSQRPVIQSIFACRGARRLCPRHGHGNKLGRPVWGQRASQLPSMIGMTRQSWGNLITWLVWLVGFYAPIRSQEPKWLTPSLCPLWR